ncbi:MAG TPA: low affinity iron permease family protein [Anaerolineales bacterium]|nr:low affinity iron permease family protein [Anaerolineales bacterium]
MSSNNLSWFTRAAKWASRTAGKPVTFIVAVSIILIWAITGPLFDFSDTWQLVINTGTTIITFLMVFLIQNTQNRDTEALQIKLDELLRAVGAARNTMIDLEELDDEELEKIREDYLKLARKARADLKRRGREAAAEVEEGNRNLKTGKAKSGGRK